MNIMFPFSGHYRFIVIGVLIRFCLFEGGSKNQAFAAAAKTHFRARRPILSFLCQMAHVKGDFARIIIVKTMMLVVRGQMSRGILL